MIWLMCTVLLAGASYLWWRKLMAPYAYFAQRGVPFKANPRPMIGNLGPILTKQQSMYDFILSSYAEFKDKRFYGHFEFGSPLFVIRDPQLIRQITTTDFEHFVDHRALFPEHIMEPLMGRSLFVLTGRRWREMRSTLSPAFTGSKMRQMFQLVVECSERTTAHLRREAQASRKPFVPEMKDLFTRFANDVIATAAFGISVDSQLNRDNEFYTTGLEATNFASPRLLLKFFALLVMPRLSKLLGIRMFSKRIRTFYHSLVHDTIGHREAEGIVRPDMIHLLMEARKGRLRDESSAGGDNAQDQLKPKWDDADLTAQCFLFFLGGFNTSSTLLCFAAHELMMNPEVQQRLCAELDAAKAELGGQSLSYDVLQKLQYLDQVVAETLRKWPPALALDRQCQRAYQMSDAEGHTVTLQPGDAVFIPTLAIHRDPLYWTDPERFEPERFSEERKGEIQPFTYMPFGLGPRNCIGSRFALMECKAFLYYLLTNFTFEVAQTSAIPLEVVSTSVFSLESKTGFDIHFKPRY